MAVDEHEEQARVVEAVKVVAEKFPGRDAVAASTLFMDWDPAYNGLAATVTKVCS